MTSAYADVRNARRIHDEHDVRWTHARLATGARRIIPARLATHSRQACRAARDSVLCRTVDGFHDEHRHLRTLRFELQSELLFERHEDRRHVRAAGQFGRWAGRLRSEGVLDVEESFETRSIDHGAANLSLQQRPFALGLNDVLPPSTLRRTEATSNAGCRPNVPAAGASMTMTEIRRIGRIRAIDKVKRPPVTSDSICRAWRR